MGREFDHYMYVYMCEVLKQLKSGGGGLVLISVLCGYWPAYPGRRGLHCLVIRCHGERGRHRQKIVFYLFKIVLLNLPLSSAHLSDVSFWSLMPQLPVCIEQPTRPPPLLFLCVE